MNLSILFNNLPNIIRQQIYTYYLSFGTHVANLLKDILTKFNTYKIQYLQMILHYGDI
jgi:hypothetical protein